MKTQELNALADRLEQHTGWLATQKLNMTLSDWCSVSNDFLDAAKVLRTAATSQASEASVETATPAQEVVVKPLEWTECRSMWFQASMCPRYEINPAVPSGYRLKYAGLRIDASVEGGAFETVEAAKAAAQADYEQRIRSALVVAPAPSGTEALRTVRDTWLALEGYLNDECSFGCCGSFSETERSNCINIIVNSLARGHAKQSEIITALSTPAQQAEAVKRVKDLIADLQGEHEVTTGPFDPSKWKIEVAVSDLLALIGGR